jgi:hypothetical protein
MHPNIFATCGVILILIGSVQPLGPSEPEEIRIEFQFETQNLNFVRRVFRQEPQSQTTVGCRNLAGVTVFGAIPHRLFDEKSTSSGNFVDFLVHYPTPGRPIVLLDFNLNHVLECEEELPLLVHPQEPGTLFRTVKIDWKGDGGPDRSQRYRIHVPERLESVRDAYSLDLVDVPVARWGHDDVDATWILFDGNHNGVFDRQFGDGLLIDITGKGTFDVRPYEGNFVSYHEILSFPWGNFVVSEVDPQGRYAKLRSVDDIEPAQALDVGDAVPSLTCHTRTGDPVEIGRGTKQYQLVFFWVSSCGSCAEDLRSIVPRIDKIGRRRLTPIGVSLDETDEDLKTFVDTTRADWPHCFSGRMLWDNELARRLGAKNPSDYVIIDSAGTLLRRGNGFRDLSRDLDSLELR